jgi:spore maturation protein CgeB
LTNDKEAIIDLSAEPMTHDYLQANLAALAIKQPALAAELASVELSNETVVLSSRTNRPIIVKRGISLHSRLDPEKEARGFASSASVAHALERHQTPFIFGLGCGYHVMALAEHCNSLFVYEPDLGVMRAALSYLDWRQYLPRVTFLSLGDPLPDKTDDMVLLVHRPSAKLEPLEYAKVHSFFITARAERPANKIEKVMIVTPLYGGSLPVARHTAQSLRNMGYEVNVLDLTPLAPLYHQFRETGQPQEKKDRVLRQMLMFVREYLLFMVKQERPDLVFALAQAPLDRGTLGMLKKSGIPTAFWFVEDYRFLGYFRDIALSYDFFFHIQGRAMDVELARLGVRHALRLPLAADPAMFKPLDDRSRLAPYQADISFMGSGYPNRKSMFAQLLDYELKIWGTEWDMDSPLGQRVQLKGRRITSDETVKIYNAARINLNLHSSVFSLDLDPHGDFINPRTFDIAACGAFQLVDQRPCLKEFFQPDREIAVFSDLKDLRRRIDFYLQRPDLRHDMGRRAREKVLSAHTYEHRMKTALDFINTHRNQI